MDRSSKKETEAGGEKTKAVNKWHYIAIDRRGGERDERRQGQQ
jgi:hypothetical protein